MNKPARPGITTVLTAGFGILVALILFLGLSSVREADQTYSEMARIQEAHRQMTGALAEIESEIHLSGITVRDYLMDPDSSRGAAYRDELIGLRSSLEARLASLAPAGGARRTAAVENLRQELRQYWDSVEPLFSWTPEERTALSRTFLRREVLPRRMAVLAITREIDRLSAASLAEGEAKSKQSREGYRAFFNRMLAIVLTLSLLVAGLSMHSDEAYLVRTLAAGARGYLLKDSAEDDLVRAVHAVARGRPFFSPAISQALLEDYLRNLRQRGLRDSYDLLTQREKEVLQMLAEGKSNKEVASILELSVYTVETHRTNLMQKLNLHNTAEIVLYAVRKKLIAMDQPQA